VLGFIKVGIQLFVGISPCFVDNNMVMKSSNLIVRHVLLLLIRNYQKYTMNYEKMANCETCCIFFLTELTVRLYRIFFYIIKCKNKSPSSIANRSTLELDCLYLRYCPTKTNRGLEWYQSKAYDLPLFRWIFFFLFKGPSLFKKQKHVFSVNRHFVLE
jgi:hypothetical protein